MVPEGIDIWGHVNKACPETAKTPKNNPVPHSHSCFIQLRE